ncbi:MAG: hypothetical protein AAF871_04020 [Pseudomonadota bacterium]
MEGCTVIDRLSEPLGFSDLTSDEEFFIILFRDWQRRGPTRAVAEHALARFLLEDRVYPALNSVFSAFDMVQTADAEAAEDSILLSEREETLLTKLAGMFPDHGHVTDIEVRPADEITRSGHDRMFADIDRSYWQTTTLLAGQI